MSGVRTVRNIYAYTTPGADRPGFLSINQVDGEFIVSLRAVGGVAVDLPLPADEVRRLCGRLTAEYRKPSGLPIRAS